MLYWEQLQQLQTITHSNVHNYLDRDLVFFYFFVVFFSYINSVHHHNRMESQPSRSDGSVFFQL